MKQILLHHLADERTRCIMGVVRLAYCAALLLALALQVIGCGGWSMNAKIVGEDKDGIPDVTVEVKTGSKVVASKRTDKMGFVRVDDLDRHGKYKVFLSKKTGDIDTIRPDVKDYNLDAMSDRQLTPPITIPVVELAGIKGRVLGIVKEEQKEPAGGVLVELERELGSGSGKKRENFTDTRPDGSFNFLGITKDGDYRLVISGKNYYGKICPSDGFHGLKVGDVWDAGEILLDPIPEIGAGNAPGFLFSIELKFQADLDSGVISEDLRREFSIQTQPIKLSEDAGVITIEPDSEWQITSGLHRYSVRKEENKLRIYRVWLPTEIGESATPKK